MQSEARALEKRYRAVITRARSRGVHEKVAELEAELQSSIAVMARWRSSVQQLAYSDNEVYTTFYKLIASGQRVPQGGHWDKVRSATDIALFFGYHDEIRFAALALDPSRTTLSNYGDCLLVMRNHMIEHRTTTFHENSVMWMMKHNVQIWEAARLPQGYRSTWNNRGRLVVAKLGDGLTCDTSNTTYNELLIKQGATPEDDQFVEAHIYGPLTVRALEKVIIPKSTDSLQFVVDLALRSQLERYEVDLEYRK